MGSDDVARPHDVLRSFGRRRGRKLSPRQELLMTSTLPRLALDISAPANPALLFETEVTSLWLEIGFGGAEHLLWQARANPGIGIIGAEPFEEGVVKALHGINETGARNVRLYADDVRPLLAWLPPASLSRAFVLFPDPWPKKRHAKRRLVSPPMLTALARVIQGGGELRLGTDIASYAGEMLLAVRRQGSFAWQPVGPEDWRSRPDDWPQTRYESKGRREGRKPYFFILNRRH